MLQIYNEEYLKNLVDNLTRLLNLVAEKSKQVSDLTYEHQMLSDAADQTINSFLHDSLLYQIEDELWKLWRTFNTLQDIKEKQPVSKEDKKLYGKWTELHQLILNRVTTSIFTADIIKTYKPKLVAIYDYCFTSAYEYHYKIGTHIVTFLVPLKVRKDKTGTFYYVDGQFVFSYYRDKDVKEMISSSYLESEVRDTATKWITTHCKVAK